MAKSPEDVIRDPYVLEFLGLTPNDDFYESDLEQALITHLQKFLLELGRGFSFVARQKRITFMYLWERGCMNSIRTVEILLIFP